MIDLNSYRNKYGFIDLDKIDGLTERKEIRGHCEKVWVVLPSGEELLFKKPVLKCSSLENPCLEVYSALFSTEVSNFLGFSSAQYDLAFYKGAIGTICPNFLKGNDSIISGDQILEEANLINRKKIGSVKKIDNSIKGIRKALDLLNYEEIIIREIIEELVINYYMLDVVLTESDRDSKNWLVLNKVKLSPRIDSSLMAGVVYLNSSLCNLLESCSESRNLDLYMRGLEPLLKYSSILEPISRDIIILFEEEFELACKGLNIISKIDVSSIFSIIENKIGTKLPEEYKKWIELIINHRINYIRKTMNMVAQSKGIIIEQEINNDEVIKR